MSAAPHDLTEKLMLLLTEHHHALFRYVFSLLPSHSDASDVMQETSLALIRKVSEYDQSKPFLPWAYRFAYLQILKHREKQQRSPLSFSPDVIELLNEERLPLETHLDSRLQALDGCLQKLPAEDRRLVTFRYDQDRPAEELMEHFSVSRRTLFRNLERIRRLLHDCVTHQIREEWA